jgi:hypothetical protein
MPPAIIRVPHVCASALSGGWKNGKASCSLIPLGNRDVLRLTPKKERVAFCVNIFDCAVCEPIVQCRLCLKFRTL